MGIHLPKRPRRGRPQPGGRRRGTGREKSDLVPAADKLLRQRGNHTFGAAVPSRRHPNEQRRNLGDPKAPAIAVLLRHLDRVTRLCAPHWFDRPRLGFGRRGRTQQRGLQPIQVDWDPAAAEGVGATPRAGDVEELEPSEPFG